MPLDWDRQFGAWGTLGENAGVARELRSIADAFKANTAGINWYGENPCALPFEGQFPPRVPRLTIPKMISTLRSQAFKLDRFGLKPGVSVAQLKAWIAAFLSGTAYLTGPAGGLGVFPMMRCLCRSSATTTRGATGWPGAYVPEDSVTGMKTCRLTAVFRHWGIAAPEWHFTRTPGWPSHQPTKDNPEGTGFTWAESPESPGAWDIADPLSDFIDQGSARAEVAAKIATVAPPLPLPQLVGEEGDTILGLEKSLFWAIAAGVGGLVLIGTFTGVARRRRRRRAHV